MKIETIIRCKDCDGEVHQHFRGDEGWGICEDCRNIEGPTYESYEDADGKRYTLEEIPDEAT